MNRPHTLIARRVLVHQLQLERIMIHIPHKELVILVPHGLLALRNGLGAALPPPALHLDVGIDAPEEVCFGHAITLQDLDAEPPNGLLLVIIVLDRVGVLGEGYAQDLRGYNEVLEHRTNSHLNGVLQSGDRASADRGQAEAEADFGVVCRSHVEVGEDRLAVLEVHLDPGRKLHLKVGDSHRDLPHGRVHHHSDRKVPVSDPAEVARDLHIPVVLGREHGHVHEPRSLLP
mmetsp:Transcript_5240/g.13201  ORF Transcript_5240/g.13201 Transcript_5240/m.13201 type:complete len:231 (-) Transcript_5240:269-961(-)